MSRAPSLSLSLSLYCGGLVFARQPPMYTFLVARVQRTEAEELATPACLACFILEFLGNLFFGVGNIPSLLCLLLNFL